MEVDDLREYFLSKPEVTEGFPFGEGVLVFKVCEKMFGLISLDEFPVRINLKCDPDKVDELRAEYGAVEPGYHMNKKHWNTVVLDGTLDDSFVESMIDDSYRLVAKGLKSADRKRLGID